MTSVFSRQHLGRYAEYFAVAAAAALPWSTSLTGLFIALWFVALVGSWDITERLRHERWMAAGSLPVALWLLAVVGMLWAHAPLAERIDGLSSFHKLLAIPFLAIQFRDTGRGMWVLIGFLISCTAMLLVSWGLVLLPDLPWRGRQLIVADRTIIGIPIKDYISQSAMFTLCIFGLAEGALLAWRKGHRRLALALTLLAAAFLANILYVATSRTALVALPILFVLFASMRLNWKRAAGVFVAVTVLVAAAWPSSRELQQRVTDLLVEVQNYQPSAASTSAGVRLEFWRRSIMIIADAPIFGHGTGSIREQFRHSAIGQTGMAALASTNPHNQILAIAIQLGLVGTVVLFAMWIAHMRLFFGTGLPAGIGLMVVVQNIVSSLFNSSLFDFTQGWVYVWGVGVLGGMMLRETSNASCTKAEACDYITRLASSTSPPAYRFGSATRWLRNPRKGSV
jgi:O-antigen ligase